MKTKVMLMLLVAAVCVVVGCVSVVDPETGETLYGVSPVVADKVETVGEMAESTGPGVTAIVSAINPGAGAIVGLVLGIAGSIFTLAKKWKAPLVATTSVLDKVSAGARASADAIDTILKPAVEEKVWEKFKAAMNTARSRGSTNPDEA